jgi:hypothetical protein
LKSLDFSAIVSSRAGRRNNCRLRRNHFPFWRRYPETTGGYEIANETAGTAGTKPGDSQMRTISFILAFAFVLAGPSMAGSADNGLPGIGTFAYHGSPVTVAASQPLVLAAK